MNTLEQIQRCDDYLDARTGKYEWRRERYHKAVSTMLDVSLTHEDTVFDVGAGWTEFDYCLRVDGNVRCRYIPVDGCIDGVDLEFWRPPRDASWFVALELLEHLEDPARLITSMQRRCTKGICISTPNPLTTDVLGMDETHKTPITEDFLHEHGFETETTSFYGQEDDSIFGLYKNPNVVITKEKNG